MDKTTKQVRKYCNAQTLMTVTIIIIVPTFVRN